ncbi:MAG: hypothetical protein M1314_01105 [Firmicutes bacterium]|nr:hypothetical protein [Bacillota bacterium]
MIGPSPALRVRDEAFAFAFTIEPTMDNGAVKAFRPYEDKRYAGKPRHRWGDGPFCRFSPEALPRKKGVYLFVIDGEIMCAGYGATLRARFNGYSTIRGPNTMKGEHHNRPQTTCRINHLVYEACAASKRVDVYVQVTDDYKAIEKKIIHGLGHPPWNRFCPECHWRRPLHG